MKRARGTRVPLPDPLPRRNVGVAGKQLTRPGRPGPTRCVRVPFHPSWCRQAWVADMKGQGEPGFPFRNPSLSATWGWPGNNSSGPAKPGLRAPPGSPPPLAGGGGPFTPSWCRQAWTTDMATASLARLTYWYPGSAAPALRAADLEVGPGLTVVAGPSGGGKSTLLRLFNGLVPHFHGGRIAGSAIVCGLDVIATPTRRLAREVGFVFQDPEMQTVYGVVEREVAFGLENLAVPEAELRPRVAEALDAVGAAALAGRRVATLSGGERQRVA